MDRVSQGEVTQYDHFPCSVSQSALKDKLPCLRHDIAAERCVEDMLRCKPRIPSSIVQHYSYHIKLQVCAIVKWRTKTHLSASPRWKLLRAGARIVQP